MRNLNGVKKDDLINILVEEYGYSESDLKDEDGKVFTNAELRATIEREDLDEKESKQRENIIVEKRKPIGDNDLIVVMNGLGGSLTHRSQTTGRVWKFMEFGQTDKLPYSELLTIRNLNPKVFNDGWMIILNPQVQDEFGLTEMYKNILTPENIDEIFEKDDDDLRDIIRNLPKGMKSAFIVKARELYEAGKIDSRRKIDLIQEEFDISLDDNAPLSDIV